MILPSRAGEDSMIEREMIRVQDKIDWTPNQPSHAMANPVPMQWQIRYQHCSTPITSPLQVTMKFSPSSHLPRDCAPPPSVQAMSYPPLDRRSSVPTRKRRAGTPLGMLSQFSWINLAI